MGNAKTEAKKLERNRLRGVRLDAQAPDHPNRAQVRRNVSTTLNREERLELRAIPKIDRETGKLLLKRVRWQAQRAVLDGATARKKAETAKEAARKLTRGPCGSP